MFAWRLLSTIQETTSYTLCTPPTFYLTKYIKFHSLDIHKTTKMHGGRFHPRRFRCSGAQVFLLTETHFFVKTTRYTWETHSTVLVQYLKTHLNFPCHNFDEVARGKYFLHIITTSLSHIFFFIHFSVYWHSFPYFHLTNCEQLETISGIWSTYR